MQYLDVPFRHRGRTRRGMDCLGLVIIVAIEQGMPVADRRVYGREPYKDGLREALIAHFGQPVDRAIQVDDVVMMRHGPDQPPAHVGIVAPHPHGHGLIHTYGEIGRVVYHRIDERWQGKIVEAFAWPDKR